MFRGDHNYYQSVLNSLYRYYGVDYVGEWHRHPGAMSSPSDTDHQTALKVLSAPEYSVQTILCVIALYDHQTGFQANPFYISREHAHFVPVAWHEMRISLEEDIVFSTDNMETLFAGDAHAWEQEAAYDEPRTSLREDTTIESHRPANAIGAFWRQAVLPYWNRMFKAGFTAEELCTPWQDTAGGRQRLDRECALLGTLGLTPEVITTKEKKIGLSFYRSRGRQITVVCSERHPNERPQLFMERDRGTVEEIRNFKWSKDDWIMDLLARLIGPDISPFAEATPGGDGANHQNHNRKELQPCFQTGRTQTAVDLPALLTADNRSMWTSSAV